MSPRTPLPPPPPPAELRSWPDREALLADRAAALDALGTRLMGGGRLALFVLWFLLLELGWSLTGVLIVALGAPLVDPMTTMLGLFAVVPGIGAMVPAVWLTVRGLRRDRIVRDRLVLWAALDRHGPTDARLRAPALSAVWLVLSFAMCAVGLWLGFAVPAEAGPDDGYGFVVYGMGAALILWVTGLTGLAKAVGHYRFALRLNGPREPAGRSASSGRPRPE
ncbi:hypothetical protein ACFV2S_17715 [Streptomyces sp. NPDC059695]|uniref:hypothetical protein n=1 Tax=Streptomyces sp. NPDC059695 TaxID=3346910 RepID=UPI0036B5DE7F